MTTAIIDGDGIVYRIGFACEKTLYLVTGLNDEFDCPNPTDPIFHSAKEAKEAAGLGGMIWTRKEIEPLDHCLSTVKNSINKILEICQAEKYQIFISGKSNFRERIYPEYKANREGLPKPKYYKDIRNYLTQTWGAVESKDVEADDMLGLNQTENTILVSQDKDLLQIPGRHYNWTNGEFKTQTVEGGTRWFYQQMLSGDPTDNIPGITGLGPVKAKALVDAGNDPQEIADIVDKIYVQNGFDRHYIDLQATLLWIQRANGVEHPFWRHLGIKIK